MRKIRVGVLLALAAGLLTGGLLTAAPAGAAPAGAAPAAAAPVGDRPLAAGLSSRRCRDINTGDNLRQLSVCSSVWFNGSGQFRGVVDMHTYRLSGGARVGDSVSQTITLNDGTLFSGTLTLYGTEAGTGTCRLNSASGAVSNCSVPNTASVTYYGKAWNGHSSDIYNGVYNVSWRDDRGQAHFVDLVGNPLYSPHISG